MQRKIYKIGRPVFLPTNEVHDGEPLWQQVFNGVLVKNFYPLWEIKSYATHSTELEEIEL